MSLESVVTRMVNAGESEANIASVVQTYASNGRSPLKHLEDGHELLTQQEHDKKHRKAGDKYDYHSVDINIGSETDPLYQNIWHATELGKDNIERTVVVQPFDKEGNPNIPREVIELRQKNLGSKPLKDLRTGEALDYIKPNVYEEKEQRDILANDIQEKYNTLLDYNNNEGIPEKPEWTIPPSNITDIEGNPIEPTEQEIQNYNSDLLSKWEADVRQYKINQNDFYGSEFFKAYTSSENNLKQQEKLTGKTYTKEDILKGVEDERYIGWRVDYIKEKLTKKFESALDWSDTAWSIVDLLGERFFPGDSKIDTEDLPEDQKQFLENLIEYKKKYASKQYTNINVLSKPVQEAHNKLSLFKKHLDLSIIDINTNEQNYENHNTFWEDKFSPITQTIDNLSSVPDIIETLNNLQTQLETFSDVAIDGALKEEDYTKYQTIYNEYESLLNENQNDIDNYTQAVNDYNTAFEEYSQPYEAEDGKVWVNKSEYLKSSYNSSLNDFRAAGLAYSEQYEGVMDFMDDDRDIALMTDMSKRDYRNFVQWDRYLKTSLLNLGNGLESAVHAVNPVTLIENGLKEYYGGEFNPFTGEYSKNVPDNVKSFFAFRDWSYHAGRDKVKAAINQLESDWMSGVQHRTSWHDIDSGYEWGEYILGASADFIPQLGLMIAAPHASLYILAASSGGSKYEQMVMENKTGAGFSMGDIYRASLITGIGEYWTEKFTLGLIKKTGIGLSGIRREGFMKGAQKFISPKNLGYTVLDVGGESISEMGAKGFENFGDILAGKNISIYTDMDEAGFNGLVMSGHIKAPLLFKRMIVPFLPKEDNVILEENAREMLDISQQMGEAEEGSDAMKALEERLNDILVQNNGILSRTMDRTNEMTAEEKRAVMDADILRYETENKIQEILKSDAPLETKKKEIEKIKNEFYKTTKTASEAIQDAQIRMDTKAAKKALVQAGIVEEGNYRSVEDVEDFQSQYEELSGKTDNRRNSDAVIIKQEDGTTFVLLNTTRQKQVDSWSAASHDTFHGIINATINGPSRVVKNPQGEEVEIDLTEEGFKLMKAFKNSLSKKERALVQKRIDDNYRYKKDPKTKKFLKDEDGKKIENAEEEYAEEYMTSYSDILRKELVKPSGVSLFNIAGLYQKYFQNKGYENLEFKSGQDIKTLVQDYAKDIKAGEVRQSILDIAGPGGATIGTVKASETVIEDTTVNEDIQTIKRRKTQAKKFAEERGVPIPVDPLTRRAEDRVVEAIKSPVGKVTETLTRRLYDPIAAEARSGVSRSEYVESLKAEINNMVIEEWNIKQQNVEKFIVNRGWLRAQSLAKRLGIESIEEFEGKGIMKRGEDIDALARRDNSTEYDFDVWRKEVRRQLDNNEISVERADELLNQITELENNKPTQELETGKVRKILGVKENSALYQRVLQDVKNELKDIDFDNLLVDKKSQKKLRQLLDKGFVNLFRGEVAKILGTQKSDKLRKLLIAKQKPLQKLIGVKYTTRFKGENSLVEKVKDKMGVQESADAQASLEGSFVMSETAGNELWGVKEMTPEQFVDIFVKGRETQYKSLVNALANELGLDAVFHPGVLPDGVVKDKNKLQEAIKRNPSVKFSETADPVIQASISSEKIISDINIIVDISLKHPWRSKAWVDALNAKGVVEASILYLESYNHQNNYGDDTGGFKDPLNDYYRKNKDKLKKVKEIIKGYFKDLTSSREGRKQYTKAMHVLLDILPSSLVNALGKNYFGLNGPDQSLVPKDLYKELKDHYERRITEVDTSKLDFDVNKVRVLNAGTGLFDKIQTWIMYLHKHEDGTKWTEQEKQNLYEEKFLQEVEDANENNPLAAKFIFEQITGLLANSTVTNDVKIGLIRFQESASNNTKAQRGLSTVKSIQFFDGSQAPYLAEINTKKDFVTRKGQRYKNGDTVGVASNASSATGGLTNVRINNEHQDYIAAEESTQDRIGEIFTKAYVTGVKTGQVGKAREAFKNDKILDEYIDNLLTDYIAKHLRVKGEHAKASANTLRETTRESLLAANKLLEGKDTGEVMDAWRSEYDKIVAEFTQILGAEINSWVLDKNLGTTTILNIAKMLFLEKAKNLNLESFKSVTKQHKGKQGTGLINRLVSDVGDVNAFIEANKDLGLTPVEVINNANILKKAKVKASESVKEPRGITVLDFDDTLATTESLVKYTTPDGIIGTLNAEQYASQYQDLLAQGYKFDFTEFDKVVKAKLAPLFNKALKLQKKFGPENMFILTARPPAAQKAIRDFLKANGLNIPLKNISTLGNSTAEAKALWIAEKVGEGYNDFYFADDALQNVQAVKNMLNQFDVKSKVQQAKVKFSETASKQFNDILESTKGLPSDYKISRAKARLRGKKKGWLKFWIPPSAEDFAGLMMAFQGKGKKGMEDAAWFKKYLFDPFARGDRDLNSARQRTATEFKTLRKKFPKVAKKLRKIIPTGDYVYGDAIRVYLWDKAGFEIPGLSKTDKQNMLDLVNGDLELQGFADVVGKISRKEEGYIAPGEYWMTKDIVADLTEDGVIGDGRKVHFAEWQENVDIIFTEENLNKIEFIYGSNFREALEDILYRMKNGSNRPVGQNRIVNQFINWLNGGISVVMNWNSRSAVLQTLSTVNFINWGDNNMAAAAKAFANQKQFWKDFVFIFNSDMLTQRRAGLRTTIESNEIMSEVEGAVHPVRAAIRYLLRVGFTPTKIADSFAIAMGGASFYRNRTKTYLKQGLSQKEAQEKAWLDFQEIAEETQQSSRPDRISMQQASVLGRFILAFQNTPMQYMRLSKKEILDLVNGRYEGVTGPNSFASKVGKITYYTAIQNVIFYSMQSALFAMMFSDDEEDVEFFNKKKHMVADNMVDGVLRGLGVHGAVISTIKNIILKRAAGDRDSILVEALEVSPPLSIKARQLLSADRTLRWNKDIMKEMETFDIDNPMWNAIFNVVEFSTNLPLARMETKYKNIRESLNKQHETWQRIAFILGWAPWNFGIKNQQIEEIKKEIKERKTYERKQKAKIKREEKKEEEKVQKIEKGKKKQEQEKKEKKQVTCLVCKLPIVEGKKYCTIHEKKEQRTDGKKAQCKFMKQVTKKKKERCGMQTSNKSGYCYYHD